MREKAVSYLRVSGKGQVRGHGFQRQREAIQKHAGKAGIEILEEFRDEGVSGTNELADRDGLAALLDRLESNGVHIVLVERADRLARDLMISEVILGEFRERGVRVLDSTGNDLSDDRDPTRKLIRQVLGAVAEFDKNVTVLKLRAARERVRKRTGRCEGVRPFGYFEREKAILETIRKLRRKPRGRGKRPLSYQKIAERLNEMGLPTRSGKPWIGPTVRKIAVRSASKKASKSESTPRKEG